MAKKEIKKKINVYSPEEEMWNSITHAAGLGFSITGLIFLIYFGTLKGDIWHIVSFTIYGSTMILTYLSSTVFHAVRNKKAKWIANIFDHCSIYLLIAGTYTPYCLVLLRNNMGWTMLAIVWGMAAIGIIYKIFFIGRYVIISNLLYVLMGWMILFWIGRFTQSIDTGGLVLFFIAQGVYSLSAIFFFFDKIKFNHVIFHLFILAASILHYITILLYVL